MKLTMPWTVADGHLNGASDKLGDVRHALGREVDHLAQVAAQMGRDAGAQADVVAHDAGKQTGVVMNRLAGTAAALGPTIAILGRARMRGLGQQAQTLGHELRQVRITTEPRRRESAMLPGIALLGGLGIGVGTGIAMMYLLDPERGKQRRQKLFGRLAKLTRAGRDAATQKAGAFANRTVGVMSDLRQSVTTGIGVKAEAPVLDADAPITAESTAVEAWPEGTRVPIG
jgi:hypothetical protein